MSFGFSGAWWQSGGATNANNLIFSPDGLSIQQNYYNTPGGYATGYVLANQASGTGFCFAAKWTGLPGYSNFGIVQGGPVAAIHSSTTAILLNNLGTVTVPGSSGFTVSGISGSAGTAYFYVNAAFTKFWVSIDAGAGGATWQDGSGTNKTTAQIVAGTGGYTTGGLTGPFDAFFEFYSAGNTGVASLIPIASWPAAAPTGAVDLIGGLATKLRPASPSGTVSAVWTYPASASGTLEYSTTGTSAWASCGGGNSGTSGTLTAGTEPTGQQGLATTYYFRDSGNTANQGIPQLLFSITPPSGVGSLVATDSLLLRGVTQPSTTYSFTGGANTKIYVAAAFPGGNYGTATLLGVYDALGNEVIQFGFADTFAGRNNILFTGGPTGATGATSVYSQYGTTSLMTGVMDASTISGGSAYGTFSFADLVNSTTGGLGPSAWPPGTLTTPRFDYATYLDIGGSYAANAFGQTLAFAFWAAPPTSESLTLTSVSGTYGGYLTALGVSNMGPPSGLNISTTGTAGTFSAGVSFTTTSGTVNAAFSITGTTVLSSGTLSVAVQDSAYTYVVSNAIPLVVSAPPLLTIDSASYTPTSEILSIQGTNTGALTALAMQIDASGFRLASSLSTSGTMYTGGIGAYIAPGSHTVQAQNTTTGQLSNIATFVVGVPPTPSINSGVAGSANAYTSLQIIPLQPVPSQQVACSLNGQAVTLNIYTRGAYGFLNLYIDVYSNGAIVVPGVICQNGNEIIRNGYFGFNGDFAFWDQEGSSDPQYTGLGSRWILVYYS